jgi:deoxycytidylate deaminase
MVMRAINERKQQGKEWFGHEPGATLTYLAADFIGRVRYYPGFSQLAGKSLGEILDLIDSQVQATRPEEHSSLPRRAYILRSFKHPSEVHVLRDLYSSAAYVIGVHSSREHRRAKLVASIAATHDHDAEQECPECGKRADALLSKDEAEPDKLGQRVRDTFHLADFFVNINDESPKAFAKASNDLRRFVDLVMGDSSHTPSIDEHLMFIAHAVANRSGALGRQVGAAIGSPEGDLIATGCNEVPCAGGGQYWPNDHHDNRDLKLDKDESNVQRRKIIEEIIEVIVERAGIDQPREAIDADTILEQLDKKRFASVIEFSRTVHAEMEAILSSARRGAPIRGMSLYTTTFPCHECARLIVGAGIRRVVYVEPYPKSLAAELFETELSLKESTETADCEECGRLHKVAFLPFSGVGPHRYLELFGLSTVEGRRRERKDAAGKRLARAQGNPIHPLSPLSYLEREERAGIEIFELLDSQSPESSEEPLPGSSTGSD